MICEKCGKEFPSRYYFKYGQICSLCFEKLDPGEKQVFEEELKMKTEKTATKNRLASALNGIFTFFYGLTIFSMVIFFIASIVAMIEPESLDLESYSKFGVMYKLTPVPEFAKTWNLEPEPQISISNLKLTLLSTLHFNSQNRLFIFNIFLYYMLGTGLGLIVLHQLRKFLSSLKTGYPFIKDNARRIKIIGVAIVGQQLIIMVWNLGISRYLSKAITVPLMKVNMYWESISEMLMQSFGDIILGLIVIAIAEIFRLGAKLSEESELTV